ncbi:lysine biosynthesis protein LysW [Micromonospora sp. WMMD1102]|uniref:lysine biosynthesis protein LysW n=1 Tax=Micromonospora sp. WMMD1102 TaxID=3016105 RepID=UPI00241581B0|nr:lysine biosynthesis protein LysW [Micromonospora sp. WMMD1102]MDG4785115.1 lysine biosynthesis protein LysW [Micromonospora sp. WMMD1102]
MVNVTTAPACVACDTDIAVPDETELGDILSCRGCGQEHEVIDLDPAVRLDRAPEVEEDWGE